MTLLPDAEPNPPRFLPHALPRRPMTVPTISCPERDYRAWKTWRDVGNALCGLPAIPFGQAWRREDEPGLAPATATLAHDGNELIIYAELTDTDIFNPIREHGAHAYPHGDVFEIFLRADGAENYFEHHLTPEGFSLQLSFPTLTSFAENCSSDPNWSLPFATIIPVRSRILVQPEIETWRVLAIVPLKLILPDPQSRVPERWRFSLCRYDHTHGRDKPLLSSTTPYPFANFHHQDMWGCLSLD